MRHAYTNATIWTAAGEPIENGTLLVDDGKIVALDTPEGLKSLVPAVNGDITTMEDVFIALTGRTFEDAEAEKEEVAGA